tara:strand:+ start:41 stop:439 length:399 start_codon:yes stop_codon:yes gene_type:complete
MSEKFTVEILTPDQSILKSEAKEVIIPSYEGLMGILKDHIKLITFLRPGIILVRGESEKKYYVEEGTVEFSNNNLLILTSIVKDVNTFDKNSIDILIEEVEKKQQDNELSDKEKYISSYKIETLKEINQQLN